MKRSEALLILGIETTNPDDDEIVSAYHIAVQMNHPDRYQNNPKLREAAENKMKQINIAFDTLKSGKWEVEDNGNKYDTQSEFASAYQKIKQEEENRIQKEREQRLRNIEIRLAQASIAKEIEIKENLLLSRISSAVVGFLLTTALTVILVFMSNHFSFDYKEKSMDWFYYWLMVFVTFFPNSILAGVIPPEESDGCLIKMIRVALVFLPWVIDQAISKAMSQLEIPDDIKFAVSVAHFILWAVFSIVLTLMSINKARKNLSEVRNALEEIQ